MTAIHSVISLCLLVWLALWLYNDYRVDRVRQELFELRDRLFDEAAAGHVSFDSPSYRTTRTMLNGMIRFAHRLSISRFFAFRWMLRPEHKEAIRTSYDANLGGGCEERQVCERYLKEAHEIVASHLISSPVLLAGLPALLAFVLAHKGFNMAAAVVAHSKRQFDALDDLVYQEGKTVANGA